MPKYFEHGGGTVFVTLTSTRSRAIDSVTSRKCILVSDWSEAIETLQAFLAEHQFSIDSAEMFTKPRLCDECLRHATQPLVFDRTKHIEECLCHIENTPCGVH